MNMHPWQSRLSILSNTSAPSYNLCHFASRPASLHDTKELSCLSNSYYSRNGLAMYSSRTPYVFCSDYCRDWSLPLHLQKSTFSHQAHASKSKSSDHEVEPDVESPVIQSSWVHKYLPSPVIPFALLARLDKPIGTWLFAWPCMWSIALATPTGSLPDIKMIALFGALFILLRGAACTVNDIIDRDIDKQVERTKLRPIASGAVSPLEGFSFFGFQLFLWLGVLSQLNPFSQLLGALQVLFVVAYPFFRRWTYWPQAFLGLTINWGALLGWSALKGSIDMSVVGPLYLSAICWTLVYDTIYAHQDKHEDVKIGVKSTALYFGDQTKLWLTGFGIISIGCLFVSGYIDGLGWLYNSSLLAAAAHLYWQIATVDINNPADCNRKFVSNKWFGAIIFSGIVAAKLFHGIV